MNDDQLSDTLNALTDRKNALERLLSELSDFILGWGGIDGSHHKQWVFDQMLRKIHGDRYEAVIKDYEGESDEYGETEYEWDEGIAP